MLQEYNGLKEIFCNNFFMTNIKSYHPLRENSPYIQVKNLLFGSRILINNWTTESLPVPPVIFGSE